MHLLLIILLLESGSIVGNTGSDVLELPNYSSPLSIDSIREGDIWNFSESEKIDSRQRGARYKLFEDSLLSETIGRHRRWYSVSPSSSYMTTTAMP